jgi:osmotically-inducible protein OsmY
MTTTLTDADVQLRNAVVQQLEWDPAVDAGAIGVSARDGTVTLTGFIDTYAAKLAAERAAKRIRGVRGVANDIEVRLRIERTDPDIAGDVVQALRLRSTVPDTVQATVRHGFVTLTGPVTWLFQKEHAEKVARRIRGVRHVSSRITVTPLGGERDVRHRIVEALHRSANVDARRITVDVVGEKAILGGFVGTWLQRDCVERAAADAPGITAVENHIVVQPTEVVEEIC